jgi:hypothetical protein
MNDGIYMVGNMACIAFKQSVFRHIGKLTQNWQQALLETFTGNQPKLNDLRPKEFYGSFILKLAKKLKIDPSDATEILGLMHNNNVLDMDSLPENMKAKNMARIVTDYMSEGPHERKIRRILPFMPRSYVVPAADIMGQEEYAKALIDEIRQLLKAEGKDAGLDLYEEPHGGLFERRNYFIS